jgi:hypothetical protein
MASVAVVGVGVRGRTAVGVAAGGSRVGGTAVAVAGGGVGGTAVSTTRVTAIGSLAGRQASNIISKTLKRKKYRFIENLPFET